MYGAFNCRCRRVMIYKSSIFRVDFSFDDSRSSFFRWIAPSRAFVIYATSHRRNDDRVSLSYAPMNLRMQLHLDCPTGIPGRSFRTGFGLQYKLRREKQTADKLINKSSATARAIILRAARFAIVTSANGFLIEAICRQSRAV